MHRAAKPLGHREGAFQDPLRLRQVLDKPRLRALRITEHVNGGLIDAPILAIANGLVGDPERFEAIRERVAATVGEGRPAAGVARRAARGARKILRGGVGRGSSRGAAEGGTAPARPRGLPLLLLWVRAAWAAMRAFASEIKAKSPASSHPERGRYMFHRKTGNRRNQAIGD